MGIYQRHGIDAEIDDEMIPVIEALNTLGLKTISSCSGHGEKQAQLVFDIQDVDIFITRNIVSFNWRRPKNTE